MLIKKDLNVINWFFLNNVNVLKWDILDRLFIDYVYEIFFLWVKLDSF